MPATSTPSPTATRPDPLRPVLTALGLLVLGASAVFGADPYGVREKVFGSVTAAPRPPAVSRGPDGPAVATAAPRPTTPPEKTVLRSQPWWQGLTTLGGSGSMTTPSFAVDPGAIQWRAKWTCETGRMVVRAPGASRPVVDAQCPGSGFGFGTQKGAVSLQVDADGPWQAAIDQQIDVPLDEPPRPAFAEPTTVKVASGDFYHVDQFGNGRVTLYRLGNGTYALRLDDFYVTPNTDLEIRLSRLPEPRSTPEVAETQSPPITFLDVTAGSMNFTLPTSVDPTDYRSVVIWCERLFSAYSAATLVPAP